MRGGNKQSVGPKVGPEAYFSCLIRNAVLTDSVHDATLALTESVNTVPR